MATDDQIAVLDAIEEVIFVGYPDGIFDSRNLLPVARRAMTATPIAEDYEGEPAFLIDGSVFGGSSGSPVFLYDRGSFRPRGGGLVVGNRFMLVGVLAAAHVRVVEGRHELAWQRVGTEEGMPEESLDLGIVFKARTVQETVEELIRGRG